MAKVQTALGEIDIKCELDAETVVKAIQAMSANSMRHIMQTVANRIVERTLPNTPQTGKLNKGAVNKLARRIRENIMPSDYLRAYPNDKGTPIWSEAQGASAAPVIVAQQWRGRPKAGRKMPTPDRIYSGQELIDYIRNNTEMVVKKKAAMRTRKDGAKVVWTTRQELQRAAKEMSKRAGNDIYGWSTLAEIAGSAAIKKTLKDGNYDKPGGDARYTPSTFSPSETVKLLAHNNNAPAETVSYNQRVIDNMIPTWVTKAMQSELKQLTPARLAKGLKLPSDIKIKFE